MIKKGIINFEYFYFDIEFILFFRRLEVWKSKTRLTSCELRVQLYELRVQIYEL